MNPSEPSPHKIGILGAAGTIGSIIATTLLEQGFPPPQLLLGDPREGLFQSGSFSLSLIASANEVMAQADIVVLCIKPQVWQTLNLPYRNGHIIVSPMAGISVETIRQATDAHIKIARFMPNTACRIHQGLIGSWNPDLNSQEFALIKGLYTNGELIEVKTEDDLNKITVASSGIAFYFYMIELFEQIALEVGIPLAEASPFILEGCLKALHSPQEESTNPTDAASLTSTLQNAFCIVYLKALELAGTPALVIQETAIAKQQKKWAAALQKQAPIPSTSATNIENLKQSVELATLTFIAALKDFFIENSFTPTQAILMAKQTVRGAYGLLTEPNARAAATLRINVTSKGGTTEAGLKALGLEQSDAVLFKILKCK
jgi:pyrroline-5-carboxylate reductase